MKVAVLGAAGYAGGELLRLLYGHPEVTEVVAECDDLVGQIASAVCLGDELSGARSASRKASAGSSGQRRLCV